MPAHSQPGTRRFDRSCRAGAAWPSGAPLGLCVGLLLGFGTNEAYAAALGSLAGSVGLFGTLATLLVAMSWPAHLPTSALSTAGGALLIAGGAAWLWRARAASTAAATRAADAAGHDSRRTAGCQAPDAGVTLPCGFERDALLAELRLHFVRLQEAWDLGAMAALQGLTTPQMLAEFCRERPDCVGGDAGRTDVVTLHAELLAFEELGGAFVASVEFSGLMRQGPGEAAAPFRELWMLMRPKHGAAGWKLARHQALI
jgi:predicted lipid-binding transport protein (Tim44 family)